MEIAYTVLIFIAVLAVLVFVHELGHFLAARKNKVKSEEFGLGFPPRAIGFYKDKDNNWKRVIGNKEVKDAKDTIYSLNFIPLGGFVKIKGLNGNEAQDKDSFSAKPAWRRAIILFAGVFMNIVLAAVLIAVGYMIGFPSGVDNVPKNAQVTQAQVQIVEVIPNSAAKAGGLQAGDVVENIEGKAIKTQTDLQSIIAENPGESLDVVVKRQNEVLNLNVTPEEKEGKGYLGIAMAATGLVKLPFFQAIWEGIRSAVIYLWAIILGFWGLIKSLFIAEPISAQLAGPISIADLTGRFARMGFVYLLQFSALLSLNLAVINILPFPALDGGRLLFLLIERIKGSPVKREVETAIHNLGFMLLMLLVLFVTFKDIARFFS
ncbi:MAG: RIP metalloprotease RseP [Candidatus Pacebacteria bacterium]|nr:RIP metalloprotease RseP [Candidatus Paceibacterota bacterium]